MDSWRRVDVPVLPGAGPAPRLHDTASGELVLAAAGPVATLYACGITPYDATHLGLTSMFQAVNLPVLRDPVEIEAGVIAAVVILEIGQRRWRRARRARRLADVTRPPR